MAADDSALARVTEIARHAVRVAGESSLGVTLRAAAGMTGRD
jgi:hypothetical protein